MARASQVATITIYNCSKQMIPLQVKPPGADFYAGEQQVRIGPGKTISLPKSHLRQDQIDNLSKKRFIRVIYDSEANQEIA